MKTAYFYHSETGLFTGGSFSTSDERFEEALAANTPAGCACVVSNEAIDMLSQKVDVQTGKIIDHQPPRPSDDHQWDDQTRRWALPEAIVERRNADLEARTVMSQAELKSLRALREVILMEWEGIPDKDLPEAMKRLRATQSVIDEKRSDIIT